MLDKHLAIMRDNAMAVMRVKMTALMRALLLVFLTVVYLDKKMGKGKVGLKVVMKVAG